MRMHKALSGLLAASVAGLLLLGLGLAWIQQAVGADVMMGAMLAGGSVLGLGLRLVGWVRQRAAHPETEED